MLLGRSESKTMLTYTGSRLLQLIPLLLGITFIVFAMMHLTGDDAVDVRYDRNGAVTAEVKTEKRAELGLDQPFLVQYGQWLGKALTGDMGQSYATDRPVTEMVAGKLPATLELMAVSLGLTLAAAVPGGILAAVRRSQLPDYLLRFMSFIGNSLPNFFVALLLIYFIALKLKLVPIMGDSGDWRSVLLPAITLAISMGAKYMRQVRALVLEELNRPYVAGARSRGVPEWRILWQSVLRSAGIPIITLTALSCGSLLGGTAIVESIFMWDGIGKLAVDAIMNRDYPVLQAYVIWLAFIYVLINLGADLAYRWLDPRLRHGEGDR